MAKPGVRIIAMFRRCLRRYAFKGGGLGNGIETSIANMNQYNSYSLNTRTKIECFLKQLILVSGGIQIICLRSSL
jgi:hypothetical protein